HASISASTPPTQETPSTIINASDFSWIVLLSSSTGFKIPVDVSHCVIKTAFIFLFFSRKSATSSITMFSPQSTSIRCVFISYVSHILAKRSPNEPETRTNCSSPLLAMLTEAVSSPDVPLPVIIITSCFVPNTFFSSGLMRPINSDVSEPLCSVIGCFIERWMLVVIGLVTGILSILYSVNITNYPFNSIFIHIKKKKTFQPLNNTKGRKVLNHALPPFFTILLRKYSHIDPILNSHERTYHLMFHSSIYTCY